MAFLRSRCFWLACCWPRHQPSRPSRPSTSPPIPIVSTFPRWWTREFYEPQGDQITIETAPGADGITQRLTSSASTPGRNPAWFAFALRNATDKPVERWLAVDRYNMAGSGVVWPDLDARRIEKISHSIGYVPERIKSDRADVFRITLEPGQTVTYLAELSSDRFARIYLWNGLEYEQKSRDRQLFNGIMLGITGLLAVFLTAVFAANHKAIFPAAAVLTWCVLAYLCVDFGFWHKLFNIRPEENAQYRAAAEAAMAASLLVFVYVFLRLRSWHGFVRMLLALWIAAQAVLVAVAFVDPRLAATFARLSSLAIASGGAAVTLFLALRGQDRALSLLPTWMLLFVWLFGTGATFIGRLAGDFIIFGLTSGLVLIVVLIGFTVTQYAFRSIEPMYGTQPGEQQLRALAVDGAGAAVWEWNSRRDEIKVSPIVEAMLGLKSGELSSKADDFTAHMHPADRERFKLLLWSMKERSGGDMRIEFRMRHVDNSYRWFELDAASVPTSDRRNLRCVGLLREVTDNKRAQERLLHNAVHDSLSGLPNRELFLDRLAIAAKRATLEPLVRPSLLFVDIDKFKTANSAFGLVVGDSLLLTVARRLGRNLGPQDTLARIGGDQFALLLLSQTDPRELAMLAEQVRRAVRTPITIAGQEIVLTASIGISIYDGPDEDPAELLREAEIAMYRAKRSGSDRIEIFNAEMRTDKDGRVALEDELRAAIEKKQLKLVYQPIFYLPTETLAGFEALLRWEHPRLGLLNPTHFVPVAEESDLIIKLGSYVLTRAVREVQRWQRELPRPDQPLFVSVNVSSRQLFPVGTHQRGAPSSQPRRHPQGIAAPGDHRIARHGEPREGSGRAGAARGRRRRAFPSTTSAPATRRSPISRNSPSTPSRWIARSCRRARRTAPARWCCGPSSLWRTNSGRKSSRRASKPRTTWASCARSAASTRRASTTASRWRSATCSSFSRWCAGPSGRLRRSTLFRQRVKTRRSRTRRCGRCRESPTDGAPRPHGRPRRRTALAGSLMWCHPCNRSSRRSRTAVNGLPGGDRMPLAGPPPLPRTGPPTAPPADDPNAVRLNLPPTPLRPAPPLPTATDRTAPPPPPLPNGAKPGQPSLRPQPPPLPGGCPPAAAGRRSASQPAAAATAAQRTSAAGLLETAAGHPGEPGAAGR